MIMRLVKIENNTKISDSEYFLDYLDCGDYYLLAAFVNSKNSGITLNQHATLKDLHKEYGGGLYYSKYCKATFRTYKSEKGYIESRNIDEVINLTEIDNYEYFDCRILKALVTGEGFEELNLVEHIVRWPNEKGGRGEYWYWLLKN
jgi:hypothetical protein